MRVFYLDAWFQPRCTLGLMCTINSELTSIPDLLHWHVCWGRNILVSSWRVRQPLDSKKLFVRRCRIALWESTNLIVSLSLLMRLLLNKHFLIENTQINFFLLTRNGGKIAQMWILFRSIDSMARGLGGPWTWRIGSAPVQMSGCFLGAALSWLRDGLLWGLVVLH